MRSARTPVTRRSTPGVAAAVLGAVAVLLLGGCGVRLETPPPAALVPDALEQVRQRVTADAVTLGVVAHQAAGSVTDEAVLGALDAVRSASALHLEALGGIYDPGVDDPAGTAAPADPAVSDDPSVPAEATEPDAQPEATDGASAPAETSPAPTVGSAAVGPEAVVTLLTETAASARADAAAVPDGALARLLASVSVSRLLLAEALRAAAALPPADPTTAVVFEAPQTVPDGLGSADVASLVQSEDAVALAWEVVAARSADDERAQAAVRASEHRRRAESWALAAGIAGTGLDPRRSGYDLPEELDSAVADPAATAAAMAALEGELATDYASLVASAAAGTRSPLVDGLLDAVRFQWRLSGALPPFPGLPEHAA